MCVEKGPQLWALGLPIAPTWSKRYVHALPGRLHFFFLQSHSSSLPMLPPPSQTYEPSLVGHALLMAQRYLRSHPKAGAALVPHLKQLLPAMALFRKKPFVVHLPPPFCVGAAGSFTGEGGGGGRRGGPHSRSRACGSGW